jgi:hypothetical protein
MLPSNYMTCPLDILAPWPLGFDCTLLKAQFTSSYLDVLYKRSSTTAILCRSYRYAPYTKLIQIVIPGRIDTASSGMPNVGITW